VGGRFQSRWQEGHHRASSDNPACIWDVRTSRPATPLLQHARIVEKAVFSPDGQRVATASLDRTARVWDARTGQALTPPLQHDDAVAQVVFSPDGRRILTTSWDEIARVWDSSTGQPLTESLAGAISSACFDPTGARIAMPIRQCR
jgi:WD40 repeat protein